MNPSATGSGANRSRTTLVMEATVIAILVVAKLGTHLALATRYGRHRDEYYLIDCGRHFAFGYVDHPPLVPWLAGLSTTLFGDSLLMLRVPSFFAGGATVWLTILLARRFGAGAYGQLLAGAATLFAPAYLRLHGILHLPAFEPVFWSVAALCVADLIDGADRKRWMVIGAVVGLGFLNKHTMLVWGLGLGVGLLATPLRADLRTKWPWLGVAIAFLIVLPHLLWQATHGWPAVEFTQNLHATVLARNSGRFFLAAQVLYMGVLAFPIWLFGLVYFFTDRGKRYRLFGYLFVTVLVVFTLTRAKPYYAAPAYPLVFAAGGAWLERWFESRRGLRAAFTGALVGTSLALAAITVPLFELSRVDEAVDRILGWAIRPIYLTEDLHDELGWPEQASAVAQVFGRLAPEERETATILTANYGQASALNLHGPGYGLPRATSGHMTHYLWGPDLSRPGPLIVVGFSYEKLATFCNEPREIARIVHPEAMESNVPIYLCRDHKPLQSVWPELKRYYHGHFSGEQVTDTRWAGFHQPGGPAHGP